jgi:hypothetical protein
MNLLNITIYTIFTCGGTSPGQKQSFGGCLYTLWPRTDHVVTFVLQKQKWQPLSIQLPTTTTPTPTTPCPRKRPHNRTSTT